MTQIAVRKGVGADFEPYNNSMELAQCTDAGMKDVKVYDHGRNDEVEGSIHSMGECYQ